MILKYFNYLRLGRAEIREIIEAIKDNRLGELIIGNTQLKRNLYQKIKGNLIVTRDELYLQNEEGKEPLKVVAYEDRQKVLLELYRNRRTFAAGRDSFYYNVILYYAGISLKTVSEFLNSCESYQLHAQRRKAIVKRHVESTAPFKKWQMDITYMPEFKNHNNGYEFILTVVDVFSKFAHAKPLKRKDDYLEALDNIMKESGRIPASIQTDNEWGLTPEEKKDERRKYKRRQQLTKEGKPIPPNLAPKLPKGNLVERYKPDLKHHITSSTYACKTQGCVERFNRTLKQDLYLYMTEHGTWKWVDALPDIILNYNFRRHSVTQMRPIEIHFCDPNSKTGQELIERAARNIKSYRIRRSKGNLFPEFEIGDTVRLRRKKTHLILIRDHSRKTGEKKRTKFKGYHRQWSRSLYKVREVYKSKESQISLPEKYLIERIETSEKGSKKRVVFADQLLLANEVIPAVIQKKRGREWVPPMTALEERRLAKMPKQKELPKEPGNFLDSKNLQEIIRYFVPEHEMSYLNIYLQSININLLENLVPIQGTGKVSSFVVHIEHDHFVAIKLERDLIQIANSLSSSKYSNIIREYMKPIFPDTNIITKNYGHQRGDYTWRNNSCLIYAAHYAILFVSGYNLDTMIQPSDKELKEARESLTENPYETIENLKTFADRLT